MVGLGDELLGGQRTCALSKRAEYNDWTSVAGSRRGQAGGRRVAAVVAGRLGVDHDEVGPLAVGDLGAAVGSAGLNHLGAATGEQRAEQIARFARTIDDEHSRSG